MSNKKKETYQILTEQNTIYNLNSFRGSNIEKIKLKDENFVNPFERQSFDLDFFMGLDSFNDIIWNDN